MTRYGMARKMKIKMGVGIIIKKSEGEEAHLISHAGSEWISSNGFKIGFAGPHLERKKKGFALREKKEQKEGKKRTRKSNQDEASYFPVRCGDTAGRKV